MRTIEKMFYVLVLIAVQSCSKDAYIEMEEQSNLSITVASNIQTARENELFDLVNEHRLSIGLNELQFESVSYHYAKEHTRYMIDKGQTSHANFEQRAKSISDKTGASDVSENVAKDYDTVAEAFEAWLDSPNHRKNLEGDYTHSALSILPDEEGELYFTQIFVR
ncbi:CAP domain-containing protein [Maribacter algicola]|uniref:CAP domain-containing protein n=1 Tax=Maribacter algicola TaxID=2498892 RepID=A0A3R8Q009_9FLAO|nr:CAP domain-containing protein [Maribacter algicola]RRQ50208.1 CAP domain-containing protein [Maribacter algicola]